MSTTPFAPSAGAPPSQPAPGGSPLAGGGAGGGQGVQILQQVQGLLSQLLQTTQEPAVQQAVGSMLKLVDPLMQAVGAAESGPSGSMSSGLANPGGLESSAPAGPGDLGGSDQSSEGGSVGPSSFSGAKKAAMSNFKSHGNFSKSGSKGEELQTDKTKNRTKGRTGTSQSNNGKAPQR